LIFVKGNIVTKVLLITNILTFFQFGEFYAIIWKSQRCITIIVTCRC